MPRPISPRVHGMIDYGTSAAVAAAPAVLDIPRAARNLFDGLATGFTGLSSLTDYPLSLKRLVPFKVHGAAELAVAAILPAMPWLLGFANDRAARNMCIGLSAFTLVVSALTDWDQRNRKRKR
ncbi:MAG TPA: hypothetical protein VJS39_11825 [Gemmatimonadaceae bacterium]|nr:hypothetical protein [Gemmatimonadaceae bacterium]